MQSCHLIELLLQTHMTKENTLLNGTTSDALLRAAMLSLKHIEKNQNQEVWQISKLELPVAWSHWGCPQENHAFLDRGPQVASKCLRSQWWRNAEQNWNSFSGSVPPPHAGAPVVQQSNQWFAKWQDSSSPKHRIQAGYVQQITHSSSDVIPYLDARTRK